MRDLMIARGLNWMSNGTQKLTKCLLVLKNNSIKRKHNVKATLNDGQTAQRNFFCEIPDKIICKKTFKRVCFEII
jgi:hypothetical protein